MPGKCRVNQEVPDSVTSHKTSVLFICAGNICRSPMAESIFVHLAKESGLTENIRVESAGTGAWHVGEKPDHRTIEVLKRHGIAWVSTARQVNRFDFESFDLLLAADVANHRDLLRVGAPSERLKMMLSFNPNSPVLEVPDPYFGDLDDFEEVFELLYPACENLLTHIRVL
jgi:protein-tyrosine phosphatase